MGFLLAIDPGEKNTGLVCLREENGELISHETMDPDQVLDFFTGETFFYYARVIVERFQLYPGLAQKKGWSGVEAVEVIGMAKFFCRVRKIECKLVGPPDVNAFWKHRTIPSETKDTLQPPHEVSAYRIGEYVRMMYPLS